MKSFFNILTSVWCLIGGIIGAGFITGREIGVFFAFDPSVTGVYSSIIVFALFIFFYQKILNSVSFGNVILNIISVIDILMLACMYAALDIVITNLLCLTKKIKLFSIVTAIIAFFIVKRGIGMVKIFTSVLVPVEIVFVLFVCCYDGLNLKIAYSPGSLKGVAYPLIYSAMNCLLLAPTGAQLYSRLTATEKVVVSSLTAAVIGVCVFFVAASISAFYSADAPLFLLVERKSAMLLSVLNVVSVFAVLTSIITTSCSVYTLAKDNDVIKFFITLVALAVSETGFSFITDKLYPIVGVISIILIICLSIVQGIFLKSPLKRTSIRLKRKV